ncbi:hypothetical protein OCK74_20215 [Chitinophagaceae bacterium LB-8]|uniref:Lipoprotein n=1 Tax=Paraflavisolibacter caeni TaxID=2982496 RepID=A0A9X2XZ07_9BACT|nr:hypothetical protein [Paraflavisolibacter caeni]MCU7551457.1 hypothetical protein [Paraflavisolibacter caeni]
MKYFKLLPMAVIVVLMVVMASCTTVRDASGEYGDDPSGRRVYYENPYYGNTIVLERDPYTGQLYQISPNGYGYGYSPYGVYNNPYNYNRGHNNRSSNSEQYNRGGRSGSVSTRPSIPKGQSPSENRQKFDDAKDKVLGGKRQ